MYIYILKSQSYLSWFHLILCNYQGSRQAQIKTHHKESHQEQTIQITFPNWSLKTQKQTIKHQTHAHIHFWTNGKHRRSQSSHHMKLLSFYHTIVHVDISVNEMLKLPRPRRSRDSQARLAVNQLQLGQLPVWKSHSFLDKGNKHAKPMATSLLATMLKIIFHRSRAMPEGG